MYEPNAFGIYDTIGNVGEVVQDCGHTGPPTDGSAWMAEECKSHVLRYSNWHWLGFNVAVKGALPTEFYGALEGFRIAEDITADSIKSTKTLPSTFEKALAKAQKIERKRRAKVSKLN